MNRIIAINPERPMRRTDPRTTCTAHTVQIHAKLARLQQLADDHFGTPDNTRQH